MIYSSFSYSFTFERLEQEPGFQSNLPDLDINHSEPPGGTTGSVASEHPVPASRNDLPFDLEDKKQSEKAGLSLSPSKDAEEVKRTDNKIADVDKEKHGHDEQESDESDVPVHF